MKNSANYICLNMSFTKKKLTVTKPDRLLLSSLSVSLLKVLTFIYCRLKTIVVVIIGVKQIDNITIVVVLYL